MIKYFKWMFTRWYFYLIFFLVFWLNISQTGKLILPPFNEFGFGKVLFYFMFSMFLTAIVGLFTRRKMKKKE